MAVSPTSDTQLTNVKLSGGSLTSSWKVSRCPWLGVQDSDGSCFSWWCCYPPGWHGRPQYLQSRGAEASDSICLFPCVVSVTWKRQRPVVRLMVRWIQPLTCHTVLFPVQLEKASPGVTCPICLSGLPQTSGHTQTAHHIQIRGPQDGGCTNRSRSQATTVVSSKGMPSRTVYLPLIRTNLIDSERDGKG